MPSEKCKQGAWSRPHWACCHCHHRIRSSLWLQLQIAIAGSPPLRDPLHMPSGSTPLYINAPYLFLCEAVGAFCKLSEPPEGATEQSNILHLFFCNTVPEAKLSSFRWSVVVGEEVPGGDWHAGPSTARGKWRTWEGNRKPSFEIHQR